jgi:hypothetical protein
VADPSGGAEVPGLDSIAAMTRNVVRAQERNLELTQGWLDSVLGAMQEQARSYVNLLHAAEASLTAVEKALETQAETNRALKESLDAFHGMVMGAAATQTQTMERIEGFLAGTLETLRTQLEALRTQAAAGQTLISGVEPGAAFERLAEEWMGAYRALLDTSLSFLSPAGTGKRKAAGS